MRALTLKKRQLAVIDDHIKTIKDNPSDHPNKTEGFVLAPMTIDDLEKVRRFIASFEVVR